MRKVGAIIKKNLKLVTRTKSSALIVIFGPLLLILLIGAAFNTANIYGVRVGTYSESYSSLTNAVIDELHKKKFSTVKIDNQEQCIESIKHGIIHVCAVFPKDLSIKEGGDITFYVDNSRLNLVYIVLDTLSSIVGSKSEELSAQLTKTIIDALDNADKQIKDKEPVINALETETKEVEQNILKVTQELQGLDTQKKETSIGALQRKLGALNTDNSSSSLVGLAEQLKREIEENEKKLEAAATAHKKSIDQLILASGVLKRNLGYMDLIDTATQGIRKDVKNVKTTSIGKIVSPLTTKIEPIAKEKTHLSYVFPTLIVLIIMFVSMMLAATLEIKEKTAKVYFKNFITPTSDVMFIVGNFITNLFIVVLQLTVLFGVAWYFFREQMVAALPNIIILPLLIATVFILLGMVLGNVFRSEETSMLAVISLGFIFLFFSSAILPIETLPEIVENIASYNPFFIGERLLNKVLLFQTPIEALLPSISILGGYVAGLAALTIITRRVVRRRM